MIQYDGLSSEVRWWQDEQENIRYEGVFRWSMVLFKRSGICSDARPRIGPASSPSIDREEMPLIMNWRHGRHVHAYVNGELMGMFNSQTGTVTGLKPGKHVLELRVVAEDHTSELDPIDRVPFIVK